MVCYVDSNFLKLFLWERFRVSSSMPREFKEAKPQLIDWVERIKTSHLRSRRRGCYKVTWPTEALRKPLLQVIDEEGSYNFWPHAYTPRGILPIAIYTKSGETISLKSRSSLLAGLQILLAVVTLITLTLRSEKGETLMAYNP